MLFESISAFSQGAASCDLLLSSSCITPLMIAGRNDQVEEITVKAVSGR
jgi:hypothetical protein